jgi:methylenetetrahydrofolate reductase (NADH)
MSTLQQQDTDVTVGRLVRDAHIEVIPIKGAEEAVAAVPSETTVTITSSPKFGLERTLTHAEEAVRSGHVAIPHLAARQVDGAESLDAYLARLRQNAIVTLYVIGGDADEPAGPYADAEQLLESIVRSDDRPSRIGVGCYPEGHPKIDDAQLLDALLQKQEYADYMVSQLCFDHEALLTWLQRVRAAGVTLPLRIGLAAPLKTSKLIELSMRIGVGSSARFLSKQPGAAGRLLLGRSYRPEELLYALGPQLAAPELNIEGLHLFSFNQVQATADWQRDVIEATRTIQ